MRRQFIIITGNPVSGFQYYGPFEDTTIAERFGELQADEKEFWVAPLNVDEIGPKLVVNNTDEESGR